MATDLPPIPPAVVEYVHNYGYKKAIPSHDWNGYKVYYIGPFPPDDGKDYCLGWPSYLLYDGKTVRYADFDELSAIMDAGAARRRERLKKLGLTEYDLYKELQRARKQKLRHKE